MELNLSGVNNFTKAIIEYSNRTAKDPINYSIPYSVRIFTLPTCAIFQAIRSIFENTSSTVIYGIGGILSLDSKLFAASATCALSAIIDPIALFVLGVSCPFMLHSKATILCNKIKDLGSEFQRPSATFNALTVRVMAVIISLHETANQLIISISELATFTLHKFGKFVGGVVIRSILLPLEEFLVLTDAVYGIIYKDCAAEILSSDEPKRLTPNGYFFKEVHV